MAADGKRKVPETEPEVSEMNEETNAKFKIVIVGGGIGGLASALALQQVGFKVKVYERDIQFDDRRQGYGLTLTNNPKGPLSDLGLLKECIARDCPSNAHWIFKPEGDILGYYGRSFKSSDVKKDDSIVNDEFKVITDTLGCQVDSLESKDLVEGRGNLRIPRQNLRRMMLERLHPGTVIWGMKLIDYTEDLNSVQIKFQNMHSNSTDDMNSSFEIVDADVLIGADGIRSVVRELRSKKVGVLENNKLITESSPLHYVGVSVILGITTASHPLINQQGFYCLDGTNRLFTMPFEDGDAMPWGGTSENTTESEITLGSSEMKNNDGIDNNYNNGNDNDVNNNGVNANNGMHNGIKNNVNKINKTKLTMWQLSFSDFDENDGKKLKSATSEELLAEAMRRCEGWFDPVCDMIKCTPPKEVWGTGLYDRNPMPLRARDQGSRVTVIGRKIDQ
jgi:2-polyprenyl-6-methoxyphenol hydroxylase-like FAD-dependent oxidoreductase